MLIVSKSFQIQGKHDIVNLELYSLNHAKQKNDKRRRKVPTPFVIFLLRYDFVHVTIVMVIYKRLEKRIILFAA